MTRLDEANDYSYADRSAFAPSSRITVYVRGDLVWGEEPAFAYCSGGLATLDGRMHVACAARDPWAPGDASVMPRVVVYNHGVASVNLSELGVRYWFTAESTSPLQTWVDYTALGNQNVTTSLQTVSLARPDADRYLSVGFAPSAGALVAGANTGPVELRFNASSWQALTETNDDSYSAQANGGAWPNVTLYR